MCLVFVAWRVSLGECDWGLGLCSSVGAHSCVVTAEFIQSQTTKTLSPLLTMILRERTCSASSSHSISLHFSEKCECSCRKVFCDQVRKHKT